MVTQSGRRRVLELQDLLRISPQEALEVLSRLDEQARNAAADRRAAPRYRFQHVPRLVVCIPEHRDGLVSYFAMVPRNISATGIGLLHGQFVHPGTAVVINLKTLDGALASVRGTIAHCRHVTGRVHEIGVHFDEPIDVDTVLPPEEQG